MICPVEIADEMSALRAVRIVDHAGCPTSPGFWEKWERIRISKTIVNPGSWFPPFKNREEPALSEVEGVGHPFPIHCMQDPETKVGHPASVHNT